MISHRYLQLTYDNHARLGKVTDGIKVDSFQANGQLVLTGMALRSKARDLAAPKAARALVARKAAEVKRRSLCEHMFVDS